jgi:hypothetical protein
MLCCMQLWRVWLATISLFMLFYFIVNIEFLFYFKYWIILIYVDLGSLASLVSNRKNFSFAFTEEEDDMEADIEERNC